METANAKKVSKVSKLLKFVWRWACEINTGCWHEKTLAGEGCRLRGEVSGLANERPWFTISASYLCGVKPIFSTDFTLGILGGGQLGKMLLYDTRKLDIRTRVLEPAADAPCSMGANVFQLGSLMDYETVLQFGRQCDVLTIEIEHVNTEALHQLKKEGVVVHPDPEALALIQDKGLQKAFYKSNNIPTSAFDLWSGKTELLAAVTSGQQNLPFVWKSTRFGYDGKGVKVIRKQADLDNLPDTACISEALVAIDKELAVIASRNEAGEIRCFPACEMVFHNEANLVEQVFCPSAAPAALLKQAEEIAKDLIEAFGIGGLLAVEFFVTETGQLLVNEVAPRPHNSGHFTIEACYTSQYEQHLRGILNLPLGDPSLKCPAVMVNLIGEPGFSGPVHYAGADAVLEAAGAYLHIYGKRETRPYRKMGHITVVRPTLAAAQSVANQLQKTIKVVSK